MTEAHYEEVVVELERLRRREQLLVSDVAWLKGRVEKLKARCKASETRLRAGRWEKQDHWGKGPMLMPFGCHKGEPVRDVPAQYAEWLLGQIKAETLKAGSFAYRNDLLGAELMKVVLRERGGNPEVLLREATAAHKRRWPLFNAERFLEWAGENKGRTLRSLWLGVAFMNKLRRKQESWDRPAEETEDEQLGRRLPPCVPNRR